MGPSVHAFQGSIYGNLRGGNVFQSHLVKGFCLLYYSNQFVCPVPSLVDMDEIGRLSLVPAQMIKNLTLLYYFMSGAYHLYHKSQANACTTSCILPEKIMRWISFFARAISFSCFILCHISKTSRSLGALVIYLNSLGAIQVGPRERPSSSPSYLGQVGGVLVQVNFSCSS